MGRKNYKWFLTFLFFHIIICLYGATAGILIFLAEVKIRNEKGAVFVDKKTGKSHAPTLMSHFKYFFLYEEKGLGVMVIICFVMVICLIIFLGYHLNLAIRNETTNESFKREELLYNNQTERKTMNDLI